MIEIEKLKFGYKKNNILMNDLNLNLQAGYIHGLLGKNGAGKTTLLKQIVGLAFPNEGSCKVMGYEPRHRSPEFLQKIFIVPEEFEMLPVKISKYVNLHAPFYPDFSEELFNKCLEEFEMTSDEKIHNLSFGQKKKVMLSFGIATCTDILLLDEPTNSLDIPSKRTFRKIIASAFREDRLIMISTHQVRDLDSLIDSVIVLHEGKIIFNQKINDVSSKLDFSKCDEETEKILYSEDLMGGRFGILKNTENHDSKVDLELLFNGVVSNHNEINNYLNN
ncbi:MAG TPA: ABC transporter ATP-binding protein [Bacteroidales bacterium]|nr:ABC transporter ATP-binding protein [Bacteroidales bacterium]HPS15691.1 ABC transporter ATP-binding protein [Bacteroidales bacterium]